MIKERHEYDISPPAIANITSHLPKPLCHVALAGGRQPRGAKADPPGRRHRGPVHQVQEAAADAGIPRGAGGIHQRRAAQPEEGISARAGGGEAHPVGAARHRAVSGSRRSEHGDRGFDDRVQLLRADFVHDRSGAAEAVCECCASQAQVNR